MCELLCPAGNEESLIYAVSAGADAVYFGGEFFNARMSADNFTKDKIKEYSAYCKLRNVKTYLTLNTVVSDSEISELKNYIEFINKTDISAVIVQSRGLLKLIKETAPDLEVHASTQLSVHSLQGAIEAKNLGFKRVVLARELSKENISLITEKSGVETECFIHGALCMCYSGQCYFSSMIGTRSGNRGRCAQPCRQMYKNGYELSLKDLSMAQSFTDFFSLNVDSFKIEGRLKSKEYISGVTKIYRKLIDEKRNATKDEIKFLEELFSRQGFTNGYFWGEPSKKMFGVRTQQDKIKTKSIKTEFKEKKVNSELSYLFKENQNVSLTAKAMDKEATVNFDVPQKAQNRPLLKEDFEARLLKTGNTPFEVSNIKGEFDNGLFMGISKINEMRRAVFGKLENKILSTHERMFLNKDILIEETKPLKLMFNYHFLKGIPNLNGYEKYARHIFVPLFEFNKKVYGNLEVSLPKIIKDNELEKVIKALSYARQSGVTDILCHTPGQISLAKEQGFTPYASYSFNLYNSLDVLSLKELGIKEATVSPELSYSMIRGLKKSLPVNVVAYGKMPLMITQNCIIKNSGECINYDGFYYLRDKTGASFPVMCDYGHKNLILNSVPLNLSDKLTDFEQIGISGFDMIFSDEKDVTNIIEQFLQGKAPLGNFTRGLYYRKVE